MTDAENASSTETSGATSRPAGFTAVTPYLVTPNIEQVIAVASAALGAVVVHAPERREDGGLGHGEIRIDDAIVMLGEPPPGGEPVPAMLYVYVDDCDRAYAAALKAGAVSILPPADQPYGDRNAAWVDAGGNRWWAATHQFDPHATA